MRLILKEAYFLMTIKSLKWRSQYIYFALLYGLSSLIVPLTTQYLVNHLSLAGLLANTLSFIVILGVFLIGSQFFKYSQFILSEYMQRQIFTNLSQDWKKSNSQKSQYFFETFSLMKNFSTSFTHLVELLLLLVFGLLVIIMFHPVFLIILISISLILALIFRSWPFALKTSLLESNQKYRIFEDLTQGLLVSEQSQEDYLKLRDDHFKIIKKSKFLVCVGFVVTQLFLIGGGIYLIEIDQLSIGQLVSAEIILSGIMASFTKLPKTFESLYDFETSMVKHLYATGGAKHE